VIRAVLRSSLLLAACAVAPAWGASLAAPASSIAAPLVAPAVISASPSELMTAVKAPGATAVLVNVWATWCVPCREEMPDLLRLRGAYADRGLRVILVSGDFASQRAEAAAFLRELGVDFPTYLKAGDDAQLIDAFDPKWNGALPATFIYDGAGQRRYSLFGKTSYATFEEKVKGVLDAKVSR
jgi:thiol-disulfide isomerase/thioredoxin